MHTSLKGMYLGAVGMMALLPLATHAETLQQVTDQGNTTTNSIHFESGSADNLFESSALYLHGTYGTGDFGGYPTKIQISSPDGNYWNDVYENVYANGSAPAASAWGHYVSDDGDFQFWSMNGPGGASHQFLTFATPEQEVAWGTGGPGGVYIPEPGLVFGPFQSNTNDLGLPNAAWRNLYVGGVSATSVSAFNVTTTNIVATNGITAGTIAVEGASTMGSYGGFPAKFVVTSPNQDTWTMLEQNATANSQHPQSTEQWGSFVSNDGSYSFYAVSSSVGYLQFITTDQLVAGGVPNGVGGVYVGPSGGTLAPWEGNSLDLGLADDSWKNIYASGTVFTAGLNVGSQARLPSDTLINNTAVCLADGTNCPSMFMAQAQQIQVPPVALADDIDGQAKVMKGDKSVDITFAKAFAAAPAVVATPREFLNGNYRITNVTKNGFTIEFSGKEQKDVLIDWHASGIEAKTVFTSKKAK